LAKELHPSWLSEMNNYLFAHPGHEHKPALVIKHLEGAHKKGRIPEEESFPSNQWVYLKMHDWREAREAESDDTQPVYFPESFRSSKRTVVATDEAGNHAPQPITVDPLLPQEAVEDTLHLIRLLNERGYQRPSVRLARNYHLLRQCVPEAERNYLGKTLPFTPEGKVNPVYQYRSDVDNRVIHAAVLLSYADSVKGHENVYRYIEGFMAYKGWRPNDTLEYQVFKEAQRGLAQAIGPDKGDLSGFVPSPGAERTYELDEDGPTRTEQLPELAEFTQYPTPELLKETHDANEGSPTYGETWMQPFYHPTTENSDATVNRSIKQKRFSFTYQLDNPENRTEDELRSAAQRLVEDFPK
jgi:hypothetical protein